MRTPKKWSINDWPNFWFSPFFKYQLQLLTKCRKIMMKFRNSCRINLEIYFFKWAKENLKMVTGSRIISKSVEVYSTRSSLNLYFPSIDKGQKIKHHSDEWFLSCSSTYHFYDNLKSSEHFYSFFGSF